MLRPEVPVAEVVLLPVESGKAAKGKVHGGPKKGSSPRGKKLPPKVRPPRTKKPGPKNRVVKKRSSRPMGHPGLGMGMRLRPGRVVSRSLGAFLVGTGPSRGEYPALPLKLALKGGKVVVSSLSPGSPLGRAGLRKGDRVLSICGVPCRSAAAAMVRLMALDWGDLLEIRAARGKGKVFTLAVRLEKPGVPKKKTPRRPKLVLLRHALDVELDPFSHQVKWLDRVTLPADLLGRRQGRIAFRLNPAFRPSLAGKAGEARLRPLPGGKKGRDWELLLSPPFSGPRTVALRSSGKVYVPPSAKDEEYARGFQVTNGVLEKRGVFLSGATAWIPAFEGAELFTFDMTVRAPAAWKVISQGKRVSVDLRGRWSRTRYLADKPQEEVYLVGGPLHEFDGNAPGVETMVFLHDEDPGLAGRYLAAATVYLNMYSRMIGPYAWSKFATVENFWETGYGMPSFTLLGPRVIRFPWILYSSFPHEILHDWWGNGVYVKMSRGNWCEGLTAYLADHLLQEQRGGGREYRRHVLEKYTNFAAGEGRDFPLSEFRERHNPATEAVGYGKALMVFHMLRRRLGNERFLEALRAFYMGMRFKEASWSDLERYFEAVLGGDLSPWFVQWTRRKGAPLLRPLGAEAVRRGKGFELTFRVRQEQPGMSRRIMLPCAVHLQGRKEALLFNAYIKDKEQTVRRKCMSLPLRVDLDPRFDVFRKLLPEEIPPTVGAVLGAREALVAPPAKFSRGGKGGYGAFLSLLRAGGKGKVDLLPSGKVPDLSSLPEGKALWVLGGKNPLRGIVEKMLRRAGGSLEGGRFRLPGGREGSLEEESLVLALPFPGEPGRFMMFVSLAHPAAGRALARKLPHYGKYGYLAFKGPEGTNTLKGRWAWTRTPMSLPVRFEGKFPPGPARSVLPPDPPLWPAPEGLPGMGGPPGRGRRR